MDPVSPCEPWRLDNGEPTNKPIMSICHQRVNFALGPFLLYAQEADSHNLTDIAMEKKTEGAWIIHHANKLQNVSGEIEFQELDFAGKCGVLLSALAADHQATMDKKKIEAIAKGAKLNIHTELPAILQKLEDQKLVDISDAGLSVLGLTTAAVLAHTSDIFNTTDPNQKERAVIAMAEETSRAPMLDKDIQKWMSDVYKMPLPETNNLLESSANIGFVDTQEVDSKSKLFFNGNLFRIENAKKFESILNSLTTTDKTNMAELEAQLIQKGCLEQAAALGVLGQTLYDKLHSIGVFDVNAVNNEKETIYYVTRPGAFGKFGNTLAEDALDLAKAFVASLTYGMTRSQYGRGRILLLSRLMDKLIRGETLNPSTAAGQDYRVLELKGVVEVRPAGQGMFTMRLLKKEVGVHAKQILLSGDVSEASLSMFPGASVLSYSGPEEMRASKRKKLNAVNSKATLELLNDLRTGAYR